MRVISWNVKRAAIDSPVWDYLLNLSPDIALLQEIGTSGLPQRIRNEFRGQIREAIKQTGELSGSHTGILIKGKLLRPCAISSRLPWVNSELSFFDSHLVRWEAQMSSGEIVNVMSAYSPAWRVSPTRLAKIDVSLIVNHSRTEDIWLTDFLCRALKDTFSPDQSWIIGGDFNTSENLRGSSPEFLDRMRELGFTECLRPSPNDPIIPTFRHSRGQIVHQLDHLFVSPNFRSRLQNCVAGDHAEIFFREPKRLSDHLPIIADFRDHADRKPQGQILTINELREFIRKSRWTLARIMPEIPHEYTLRKRATDEKLFERVVLHIQEGGYEGTFGSDTYTYLDIDGWKYWTMGAPLEDTTLINRAKIASE
jgi:exonuclease III